MVIRVDLFAKLFGRKGSQNFVHVHVRAGSAAGLENIDREVVKVVAQDDLFGTCDNRRGDVVGKDPKFVVRLSGSFFDAGQRDDVFFL